MQSCKICQSKTDYIFRAKVLGKYDVKYFHCPNCGYIQTEEPYWLEKAYSESISALDTGVMARNIKLANITAGIILLFFDKNAKFLDYAGGYGIFTRLMRDAGFDFYWYDKYSPNLVAKGFEYKEGMNIELITCFEAFEHFENPMQEIENMIRISPNIIFTTELYDDANSPPSPDEWWYYTPETGQHIGFFHLKTLRYIANKYNLNLYSNGRFIHIFTAKSIPFLSNELLFKILARVFSSVGKVMARVFLNSKVQNDFQTLLHQRRALYSDK